jgi:Leishmanolysin
LQPKLTTALALSAIVLAACVDSQSPEVQAPDARKGSTGLPKLSEPIRSTPMSRPTQSEFNVRLRFLQGESETPFKEVFLEAAARWEKLIVKDKPDDEEDVPPNVCGIGGIPGITETVDDMIIDVIVQPIDGEGAILGAAGPCWVRGSDFLTVYGIMFFDVADLADIADAGVLDEVIVHEMGHVIGIGSLWDAPAIPETGFAGRNLLQQENTSNPIFVGVRANVGYQQLGGTQFVPVEGDFGPGTALGHWDEDTFGNELMTGFISFTGPSPLSDVTAGSLRDLGYVARAQGEPYTLPTPEAAAAVISAQIGRLEGISIGERELLIAPKVHK